MKVKVEIRGYINIPDIWVEPNNTLHTELDIARYHYNEKLDVEDAVNDLSKLLKEYPVDLYVVFPE